MTRGVLDLPWVGLFHTRSHPAFLGSEPFSTVNRRLRELGRHEIEWSLEP